MLIDNYTALAKTPGRQVVLDVIEAGLEAIQPEKVVPEKFKIDTGGFRRIFLLGFGKGSARISKIIAGILGEKLASGWVIDLVSEDFPKINFTVGTHPLPSTINEEFTKTALIGLYDLQPSDLVLVVICGGGSAMLVDPKVPLENYVEINKGLLKSGATISEMNTIRKHLDGVKGGGLAARLYPGRVVSLIFSDVPGNDLSVIASGPTVLDPSSVNEAWGVLLKLGILGRLGGLGIKKEDLVETPKDERFFVNVTNELMLSNLTALSAMEKKAAERGLPVKIYSDRLQGEARDVGKLLIENTPDRSILLAGGETTVTVNGGGQGGRNQELVLGALPYLSESTVVASVGSDGSDNSPAAGAIGDFQTTQKSRQLGLNINQFLENNDSYNFFRKVGDGIETGKLSANVSDLMVILKNG